MILYDHPDDVATAADSLTPGMGAPGAERMTAGCSRTHGAPGEETSDQRGWKPILIAGRMRCQAGMPRPPDGSLRRLLFCFLRQQHHAHVAVRGKITLSDLGDVLQRDPLKRRIELVEAAERVAPLRE